MKRLAFALLGAIVLWITGCGDMSLQYDGGTFAPFDALQVDVPRSTSRECLYPGCESLCSSASYTGADAHRAVGPYSAVSVDAWRRGVVLLRGRMQPPAALASLAGVPFCTGTLIGDGTFLLTASHCLKPPPSMTMTASNATPAAVCDAIEIVSAQWQMGGLGGMRVEGDVRPCTSVAEINTALDYAILRIATPPRDARPMRLATRNPALRDVLLMLHHPGGREMVASFGEVTVSSPALVRHRCDTEGGSSGCGMLNRDGEIVALHVAGGCTQQDAMSSNRAVPIEAIFAASSVLRALPTPMAAPPPSDLPAACPMGQTRCGDTCVDTQTSTTHCGACGTACTSDGGVAMCAAGSCVTTCPAGHANCDNDPSNGCEVALGNDPMHCGMCGARCALPHTLASTCSSGTCRVATCAAAYGNCDAEDANGCESSYLWDNNHCGGCGRACPAGTACWGGACSRLAALCGAVVECGPGTACSAGMTCLGSGASVRCVCNGSRRSCTTGEPAPEGPDTWCAPTAP